MKKLGLLALFLVLTSVSHAHDGHSHAPSPELKTRIFQLNTRPKVWLTSTGRVMRTTDDRPEIADHFKPFEVTRDSLNRVNVRWDDQFLYVESKGMPDHEMMTGITAWQQQVPLPQDYSGNNAWRIPLKPVPAEEPMSAKDHFFRGAIALAVNGVPIFNPIKNDGRTDTFLAGELDQWGGHCGRADDYHYHIGPVHLERIVGKGNPIGIALDGYLLYGYEDPSKLDWLNGQEDENGDYHYHSTKTYPYINGGFYGTVVERNGQVDPQPRAQGVRPALPPLRGAKITGYENPEPGSHVVRYEVRGEKRSVEYKVADNGSATFNFVSPQGTITENHTPRQRGGGGRGNAERPGEQRSGEQGRGDRSPTGTRSQGRQIDQLQPGGGSDPIARTLDANGDGQIDKAEWLKASAALRTLDQNQDGRITVDELGTGNRRGRAGEGEQPGGARPPGPAGSARGPQPGDGPRQPWIVVHADEVDLNQDKIISRAEIVGEASKAFAGYDANRDGKLTDDELGGRGGSRSAMGGFIRGHAGELDRDGDGSLTRAEVVANAARMFEKMDSNRDDTITTEELKNARR